MIKSLDDVKLALRTIDSRFPELDRSELEAYLKSQKVVAVGRNDQELAKTIWCLETVVAIQFDLIESFQQFKNANYYRGWGLLEQVDIALGFLRPHFAAFWGAYNLGFIEEHVARWQALFPYKYFFSPELLELEKQCNICNQVISIRHSCGHEVGEIYNGEMCCRVVTKVDLLGIALVSTKPMQKYSVAFPVDPATGMREDQFNYGLVSYVARRLHSPFDGWSSSWTKKRHPHSRYAHVGRNDPCPCESGNKYKKCCLLESGVLAPHLEVQFSVPPPPDLPPVEYSD